MVDIVRVGNKTEYRCDIDGTVLWVEYDNGEEVVKDSCTHLKWFSVGNGCYPDVLDENICKGVDTIVKYHVKMIKDGTTYYFLVPNYRDYN